MGPSVGRAKSGEISAGTGVSVGAVVADGAAVAGGAEVSPELPGLREEAGVSRGLLGLGEVGTSELSTNGLPEIVGGVMHTDQERVGGGQRPIVGWEEAEVEPQNVLALLCNAQTRWREMLLLYFIENFPRPAVRYARCL